MIKKKRIVNIHQQQGNKRNVKWCPSRDANGSENLLGARLCAFCEGAKPNSS